MTALDARLKRAGETLRTQVWAEGVAMLPAVEAELVAKFDRAELSAIITGIEWLVGVSSCQPSAVDVASLCRVLPSMTGPTRIAFVNWLRFAGRIDGNDVERTIAALGGGEKPNVSV